MDHQPLAAGPSCPICAWLVQGDSRTCPDCEVVYHRECFAYFGRCAIYGCHKVPLPQTSSTRRPSTSRQTTQPASPYWSGMGVIVLNATILSLVQVGIPYFRPSNSLLDSLGTVVVCLFVPAVLSLVDAKRRPGSK
jgi:hypothetical protein